MTSTKKTYYILSAIFFILYALRLFFPMLWSYAPVPFIRLCQLFYMAGILTLGISLFWKKIGRFTLIISAILAFLTLLSFTLEFLSFYAPFFLFFDLFAPIMRITGFVFLLLVLCFREKRLWFLPFLFTVLSQFFTIASWIFSIPRYAMLLHHSAFTIQFLVQFSIVLIGAIFLCLAMLFLSLCLKTDPWMHKGNAQTPYNNGQ